MPMGCGQSWFYWWPCQKQLVYSKEGRYQIAVDWGINNREDIEESIVLL